MDDTHVVQIFDNNQWLNYFTCCADKFEDEKLINLSLRAFYYGSSSRIGKLGEVVSNESKKPTYIPKKLRVKELDKNVIFECNLSIDMLTNNFVTNDLLPIEIGFPLKVTDKIRNLNGKVIFRDLHRFIGNPIEISGISIEIIKKN